MDGIHKKIRGQIRLGNMDDKIELNLKEEPARTTLFPITPTYKKKHGSLVAICNRTRVLVAACSRRMFLFFRPKADTNITYAITNRNERAVVFIKNIG